MVRSQSRQGGQIQWEYPYGEKADDNNPAGFYLKDHVRTITGALTGFDGAVFSGIGALQCDRTGGGVRL